MPIFGGKGGQKGWKPAKDVRRDAESARRKADFKAAKKGNQAAADRVRQRGR